MKLVDYTRTEWTMAYCIHCVWEFIKEGMKGKVILYHLLIKKKKKKKVILYHLPFIVFSHDSGRINISSLFH